MVTAPTVLQQPVVADPRRSCGRRACWQSGSRTACGVALQQALYGDDI